MQELFFKQTSLLSQSNMYFPSLQYPGAVCALPFKHSTLSGHGSHASFSREYPSSHVHALMLVAPVVLVLDPPQSREQPIAFPIALPQLCFEPLVLAMHLVMAYGHHFQSVLTSHLCSPAGVIMIRPLDRLGVGETIGQAWRIRRVFRKCSVGPGDCGVQESKHSEQGSHCGRSIRPKLDVDGSKQYLCRPCSSPINERACAHRRVLMQQTNGDPNGW